LAAAAKDEVTVAAGGAAMQVPLLDGMVFHETATHHDERGSLTEMIDGRWTSHPDPIVYGYGVTIRPGIVKGWALHKTHEDRYFVVQGQMELLVFDPRPESKTVGKLARIVLSGDRPRLLNIPRCVWHADRNIGTTEVLLMNFPTRPYDHANPDKYRLPLDTPLIPFDFGGAKGW
jgi:dTDP-4-dehydrorhamnose 3,5-epimerase